MIDLLIQQLLHRIRDALPGHTTASRLMRDSGSWRNLPPHQRAAAYVQHVQTQRQLRQLHIELKIAPKIVNVLFKIVFSEPGCAIGLIVAICTLYLILNP
jgi:hypothetical protein